MAQHGRPKSQPAAGMAPAKYGQSTAPRSLTDIEVDAVRVEVLSTAAPRRKLLDIRIEHVGTLADARPWISIAVLSPGVLRRLEWARVRWDAVLRAPWRLPLMKLDAAEPPCVPIWRDPGTPIACGRLVMSLVTDALEVRDPSRVRIRRDEADGPVLAERTRLVGVRATPMSRHSRILASCAKCGRPLRDPEYAKVGIGPECIKSYPAEQVRLRRQINQAARTGRQAHLNAKPPTQWLSDVADHWRLR